MSDDHNEELASLYVLGVLPPDEAEAFAVRVEQDPRLMELVARLQTGAAALAAEAPVRPPPAHVRARLLEQVRKTRVVVPFPQRFAAVAWAAAAGLALLAGVLTIERVRLQQQISKLERQDALSQLHIATLTSLVEGAPNTVASIVWDEAKQEGVLDVRDLPAPAADQDYQLWVIDPKYETPVSAGIFAVQDGAARTKFKPTLLVHQADKFAVSVERKGGSPRNAGPIVLLGH